MTMPFMVSVIINRVYNEEHSFIRGAFFIGCVTLWDGPFYEVGLFIESAFYGVCAPSLIRLFIGWVLPR